MSVPKAKDGNIPLFLQSSRASDVSSIKEDPQSQHELQITEIDKLMQNFKSSNKDTELETKRWLIVAEKSSDPEPIYSKMEELGIGTYSALYYLSKAKIFGKDEVLEILEKGNEILEQSTLPDKEKQLSYMAKALNHYRCKKEIFDNFSQYSINESKNKNKRKSEA